MSTFPTAKPSGSYTLEKSRISKEKEEESVRGGRKERGERERREKGNEKRKRKREKKREEGRRVGGRDPIVRFKFTKS